MALRAQTLDVLRAVAARETASGLVSLADLIDATGLGPELVVNELERLIRDGHVTGKFQRTFSGGDPRPWFLVNPLLSERGILALNEPALQSRARTTTPQSGQPAEPRWDAFISHAHEDKAGFVNELAEELNTRDLAVWYDDDVLEVGDSVRKAIDEGLRRSDFGIVVISRDFMRKDWTNRELDGILGLEQGVKRLLPVWHQVIHKEVQEYSPMVAERYAVQSNIGVPAVADALCRSMRRGRLRAPTERPPREGAAKTSADQEKLPPANPRLRGIVRPTFARDYLTGVTIEATDEGGRPVTAVWHYVFTMNGNSSPANESCCTPMSIGMGGVPRGTTWSVRGWVKLDNEIAPLSGSGVA